MSRFWIGAAGMALLALVPLGLSTYYINLLSLFLIMGLLALSLDVLWGYSGLLSFGQAAFFGLGGYVYAIASINSLCEVKLRTYAHYSITCQTGSTYFPLLLSIVVPTVFAAALGYFLFYARISGVFFSIITLSVTLILQQIATELVEAKAGNVPIGGYNGITGIPPMAVGLGGWVLPVRAAEPFYYFVLLLCAAALSFCFQLARSSLGKALLAIKDNELRTETFGYDVRRCRLWAFMISGGLAGLSGALYAAMNNFISPWAFDFVLSAEVVIWVLVGGRGTLLGAFIGAFGIQLLENLLSDLFVYYWLLVVGVIFMCVVLVFPDGVVGALGRLGRTLTMRRARRLAVGC